MMSRTGPAGFLMRDSWRASELVLTHRLELAGGQFAPAAARATMTELLACRLGEDDLFDVSVLVSELVTNAVRHASADERQTIVVYVALTRQTLRMEVCDQGPGFEPPDMPRSRPEGGGNGLVLLARMSSDWGVAAVDGTCVWFERVLGDETAAA